MSTTAKKQGFPELRLRALMFAFLTASALATPLNSPAPAFTLLNGRRQPRALADYHGKVVLINFWASWCAPCRRELPQLEALAAEYRTKNVRVLAINVDEDRDKAKRLLTTLGLQRPALEILWDTESKAVKSYDITAMPSSMIVDRRGIVRYAHAGYHAQDPNLWRREIESLRTNPKAGSK